MKEKPYLNREGYRDPVPYAAIRSVMKEQQKQMMRVTAKKGARRR